MITLKLQSNVALYVPTTIHVDQQADTMKYVSMVQLRFGGWFGGTTTTEALGGYMSSEEKHIGEKVYIVRSYCTTTQLEEYFPDVVALGDRLCQELDQESITGEINGTMFFMDGS